MSPTAGFLLFALFTAFTAVTGFLVRRRAAARRLDMGAVSASWLAQIGREHDN